MRALPRRLLHPWMAQTPMSTVLHLQMAIANITLAGIHIRCATTGPVLQPDNHAWARPRVASQERGAKEKAGRDQPGKGAKAKAAKDPRATTRQARCPEMSEIPALPDVVLSTTVVVAAEKGTTQEGDLGGEACTQFQCTPTRTTTRSPNIWGKRRRPSLSKGASTCSGSRPHSARLLAEISTPAQQQREGARMIPLVPTSQKTHKAPPQRESGKECSKWRKDATTTDLSL